MGRQKRSQELWVAQVTRQEGQGGQGYKDNGGGADLPVGDGVERSGGRGN